MAKTRKHNSPPEKAAFLRKHLIDRVAVSDLCDKHGIHPTLFFQLLRTLFENLPGLFEPKSRGAAKRKKSYGRRGKRRPSILPSAHLLPLEE